MPRLKVMLWRSFTFFSAFSMLLCITMTAFCARSFWIEDGWRQITSEVITVNSVSSNHGCMTIFWGNPHFLTGEGATDVRWVHWQGPATHRPRGFDLRPMLGFAWRWLPVQGAVGIVPLWMPILLTGALPAVWWCIRRRRRGRGFEVEAAENQEIS